MSERTDIDRSFDLIYPTLRDQNTQMQWSAWPEATGSTCSAQGDGRSTGSSIALSAKAGKEMGRQTITSVTGVSIHNRMRNRGPGGRVVEPEIDFDAEALDSCRTRVRLDLRLDPPLPALFIPIARPVLTHKIRPPDRQDLMNLKHLLERS